MQSKLPAVILSMGINGLSVARNLNQRGIPIIGIDEYAEDISRFSRYCKKYYQAPSTEKSDNEFLDFLIKIGRELSLRAVLIPTSDKYVLLTSKNQESLREYFRFEVPAKNLVERIINKEEMYKMAIENDIPVPDTFFPKNLDEVKRISEEIKYPYVIKPIYSHITGKKIGKKLLRVNNREELLKVYSEVSKFDSRFMVQELVEGKDDRIYIYTAYCRDISKPEFEFCGRKIRQGPPHFGTASLAESLWDQDVVNLSTRLLRGIKYKGIAGVEFKKDIKDENLKLMEINARLCQWHGITRESGVDLCYAYYLDLIGETVLEKSFTSGKKWLYLKNDLISSVKYVKEGSLSIREWIISLKGISYFADFDLKDPLPFIVSCLRLFKSIGRKFINS